MLPDKAILVGLTAREEAMRSSLRAVVLGVVGLAAPAAFAAHDHYIDTPGHTNTELGKGQTSIEDSDHGGFHRLHDNVHLGTPGSGETPSVARNGVGRSGVGTTVESNPVTIGKTSDLAR